MALAESVDSPSHDSENTAHHVEVVILAPFVLLAVGALLRHSTKSLPLPYTMQLLIVGTIIGVFLRGEQWNDTLQESMEILG